mgnify:FL=1
MLIKLRKDSIEKSEKDNGITLVALVITVIIIIILATVTLNFTFGEDGIITKANQAKYMAELSTFQEELGLYKANKQISEEGFSAESITAGEGNLSYVTDDGIVTEGTIYDVITSLRGSSFAGKMEIIKGELLINSQDMEEIRVAQSMGIQVNPYIIVDGELKSDGANLALMDSSGTLTIPDGVTAIGEGAFADLSGLKTIIIPGTVKEIRQNAFRNNADLENVILQEGVEVIGYRAFQECGNLKNVELPESLIEIGAGAFFRCSSINNIIIPSKIEIINAYTFYYCTSLTNIELPDGLQTIGGWSFQNCTSLEEIYIPGSVNSINSTAFMNCTSLNNIEVASGNQHYKYDEASGMLITTDGTNIVFISAAILRSTNTLNIPQGVTSFTTDISEYRNITTIIIPTSLERIGTAEIFPLTISNVEVAEGNNYFTEENECLYNKDKTNLIMCFTKDSTVKLADTLTTVNDFSFKQAPNIGQVNFPDAVTTIGAQVFTPGLTSLENINIGPNVTYIHPLFKWNNYYGEVTIDANNPNYTIEDNEIYNKDKTELIAVLYEINGQYIVKEGVTKIGDNALHYRTNMTSIVLPDGLKEIGSSFQNSGLTTIYIPNSVDTIESNAFLNAANLTQIQIDKEPGSIAGSPWGAIRGDRIVEWLR